MTTAAEARALADRLEGRARLGVILSLLPSAATALRDLADENDRYRGAMTSSYTEAERERDAALARIAAADAVHRIKHGYDPKHDEEYTMCVGCSASPWPCATHRALHPDEETR